MKKKLLLVALAILSLGALSAAYLHPSWLAVLGLGPERSVRKRAEGYWNARVANDLKAMAPFEHPLQGAIQDNSVLITDSFEITDVTVDGDSAHVMVSAKYFLKLAKANKFERELTIDDPWVRYKGEWYHALHPVGFGDILKQGLGKWKPPVDPNPEPGPKK